MLLVPMEDIFDKEEHAKNIYVIKHKLADLKMPPYTNHYEWQIGSYLIKMFPTQDQDHLGEPPQYLTQYEKVDVQVYKVSKRKGNNQEKIIDLQSDPLFCKYRPIMYNTFEGPHGTVNLSNGRDMPMYHLCELIRYLHRLANLAVFT
jgi:hypothetical protein